MSFASWLQDARFSLALLGPVRKGKIPSAPAHPQRDLWTGSAITGEQIIRGRVLWNGITHTLGHNKWSSPEWSAPFTEWFQGFSWLRDLRELGTDSARRSGRILIASWIGMPLENAPLRDADITGARLGAWFAHYDFFISSADEDLKQRFMQRVLAEARTIAVLLPIKTGDWRPFQAIKGLLATALAIPAHNNLFVCSLNNLEAELTGSILPDGMHASRSPEIQFRVLRELAEIRHMLQNAQKSLPGVMTAAADRMAAVLRSLRHGDGTLALFNGALFHPPGTIEQTLLRASPRAQVMARSMPNGRFLRLGIDTSLLLVDAGNPPPQGFDSLTHAGALSFEFSSGRHQLIVNCGDSLTPQWHEALRDAPAHSTLIPNDADTLLWHADGTLHHKPEVSATHESDLNAHVVNLSLSGFHPASTGIWNRRLYLGQNGRDFRGEDRLEGSKAQLFVLRFHLHPNVRIEAEENDILLHLPEETWRFRSDGLTTIEESIWFGGAEPRKTWQIVVHNAFQMNALPEPDQEPEMEQVEDIIHAEENSPAESPDEPAENIADADITEIPELSVMDPPPEAPAPQPPATHIRWAFTRMED